MNTSDMIQNKKLAIEPDKITVGELVAQNYHAAGVFREYGLDFCCGGGVSLRKACEKSGLDPAELLDRLEEIPWAQDAAGNNYQAWQPDYLIDHIVQRHHRYVREKTAEIGAYAEKVAKVYGERYPENIKINRLFSDLTKELLRHLQDEEAILFPLIEEIYEKRLSGRQIDAVLAKKLEHELERMVGDHEGAGAVMAEIRELSGDYTPPADACTTFGILYMNLAAFEEDLHLHVHLENNILFRKAEKLI